MSGGLAGAFEDLFSLCVGDLIDVVIEACAANGREIPEGGFSIDRIDYTRGKVNESVSFVLHFSGTDEAPVDAEMPMDYAGTVTMTSKFTETESSVYEMSGQWEYTEPESTHGFVVGQRVTFVGMKTWEVGESIGRFTATNGATAWVTAEDWESINLRFDDPEHFLLDYNGGSITLEVADFALIRSWRIGDQP